MMNVCVRLCILSHLNVARHVNGASLSRKTVSQRHHGGRMPEFLDGRAKTQLVYDPRSELMV